MNFIKGIYYYISGIAFIGFFSSIITKILGLVLFPISYPLRWFLRDKLYSANKALVEERVFEDTQNISIGSFFNKVNKINFYLWLVLDDSPSKDAVTQVRENTYNLSNNWDSSDTRRFYPFDFVYNIRILRDFWWGFIRNSCVNYFSWYRTGGWTNPLEYKTLWGKYDERIDKNDDNSYYFPGFYLILIKHNNGNYYPYFRFIGSLFGRKVGIWQGRSQGSGRFSFSVRA